MLLGSIPPLSVVGLSEEEAVQQANGDILVFTSTFNPMKNTISGYACWRLISSSIYVGQNLTNCLRWMSFKYSSDSTLDP